MQEKPLSLCLSPSSRTYSSQAIPTAASAGAANQRHHNNYTAASLHRHGGGGGGVPILGGGSSTALQSELAAVLRERQDRCGGGGGRNISKRDDHSHVLYDVIRGSQGDVVYLCWPIAPSYTSPNAEGWGGGGVRGLSQILHLCK